MLTFNAELHEYRLDGVLLPNVTGILRDAGLIDARYYTEESRTLGTYVHRACAIPRGELALDSISEYRGHVEAWWNFLDGTRAVVRSQEFRVHHQLWQYAGTIDLLLEWQDRRYLIDIKTGNPEPWHTLQTAAYALCLTPAPNRAALYLRDNGTYRLAEHTDTSDATVFLAAVQTENWKRQRKQSGNRTGSDVPGCCAGGIAEPT